MTLRDKKFEKAMRRRVRKQLRRSKALWREFRRGRSWFRRNFSLPFWVARLFLLGVGLQMLTTFTRGGLDMVISVVFVYGVLSACWQFSKLKAGLHFSPRLAVFALMPVSDQQVLEFQGRAFVKSSLWSILDFTVLYGVLASRVGYGDGSIWAGLTLGIFQWILMLGVAVGLVAFLPRRKIYTSAAVWVVAILAVAAFAFSGRSISSGLASAADWVPPLGWVLYAMGIKTGNVPATLFTAAVAGLALAALPCACQKLRRDYVMPIVLTGTENVARLKRQPTQTGEPGSEAMSARSAVKASLQARGIAAGFDWKKAGWLERKITGWLKPEDLLIAEFLCAGNPRWTAKLIKTGLICIGFAILACVFPTFFRAIPVVSVYFAFYLLGFFGNGWDGLGSRDVSGNRMTVNTVYPVGFWQLARVMVMINFCRLAFLSLFLAVACGLILYAQTAPLNFGSAAFLKGLTFLLILQPVFPVLAVTSATTDTRSVRLVLLFILGASLFCGASVAFFAMSGLAPVMIIGVVLCLLSTFGLLIYGHAYNHNWFDVQRKPDDRRANQASGG